MTKDSVSRIIKDSFGQLYDVRYPMRQPTTPVNIPKVGNVSIPDKISNITIDANSISNMASKISMVSRKMKVNTISEDMLWSPGDPFQNSQKSNTSIDTSKPVNTTRDTIALALEVSNRCGVPVLFLSNPGDGKTTGVKTYGRFHKRHVEFLMGSQYTQEDILGFMTNTGKEYLEVKIPEWYYRLMEYTKWHWELKDDPNFELGYTDRKKLLDEKKLYLDYKNGKFTPEQLLDMDIPFDQMDIDARIAEIDKDLKDKFVWVAPRSTILFLDELSAASPTVQGSLLRLCHERMLRGNNALPKDCIVCAAGNFRRNLPSFMEIIAPELNRFCIINLLRGSETSKLMDMATDLVMEATQGFYENTDNFPTFEDSFQFTPEMETVFLKKLQMGLIDLFGSYTDSDSPNGIINFRNTSLDGMFDGPSGNLPEISNFISVRTVSYFARTLKALCEFKISPAYLNGAYKKFSIGLLGLGTNSWDSKVDDRELQIVNYQKELNYMVSQLLSEFNHPSKDSIKLADKALMTDQGVIPGSLNETIRNYIKSANKGDTSELQPVLKKISETFPSESKEVVAAIQNRWGTLENVMAWRADFEAIKTLLMVLENTVNRQYVDIYISALKNTLSKYEFYYNSSLSDIGVDDLKGV